MTNPIETDVVVLGAGPGGYSAAYRAADLGLKVTLVERYDCLGGVCLNVGCIPSKALLHAARVIEECKEMANHGISFGEPTIDLEKLRSWKDGIIQKLTTGLKALAKQRKVTVLTGEGQFSGSHTLTVKTADGEQTIQFKHAIIAAGSEPVKLPFIPEDPRIMDSTGALKLEDTKGRMLILGGGIIGLEMATVYHALGSTIDVVEFMDQLMPEADKDLVTVYQKRIKGMYDNIMLGTKVVAVEAKEDGLYVSFEGKQAPEKAERYDRILVSVGRKPNGHLLAADKAGVTVDERGFIPVDKQCRTNVAHIHAIGDVAGNPMLAHKSVAEGHVVAEVIAGAKHGFDTDLIPSVAYTDPEIAWVGLTEKQAKKQGIDYEKGAFPWMASGRALATDRSEGITKLLFCPKTHRVLGGGIIGLNAGELIAEVGLAIEMGCDAEDIALTIHPHPTLSETVMLAAEVYLGTITDLYVPKKKKKA
jgi:dihydrolipoamide dehydrogenase